MPEVTTTPTLASRVEEIAASAKKSAETVEKLVEKASGNTNKNRSQLLGGGAPAVRKGEDSMGSRGYSFARLFQCMSGQLDKDKARVEIDTHNQLQKLYVDRLGYEKAVPNSILVPMSSQLLAQQCSGDEQLAREIGEVVRAGVTGYDPEEIRRINKTLSWQDETALGSLVAPPVQGELIDLLRNNEVFTAAGARVMPMPPNGRIVYPRQTGPSTASFIGESVAITASEPTTGDVILQAKKLAAMCKIPNELFRFSSVSVEMFIRDDIAKVVALKLDSALLQGVGSAVAPKGLINYAGIGTHTATRTDADGDYFQPEDVALMIGKVEEANAQFKGFVMRPLMYTALVNRRADSISANDGKGPFVFSYLRSLEDQQNLDRLKAASLYGYPAWKSTNVSNTRAKGSGTALSYILGGDFSDYILGMSAVMEFAISTQGDTPFSNDQTWVRGIMMCDGAPRREASFVLCDTLRLS